MEPHNDLAGRVLPAQGYLPSADLEREIRRALDLEKEARSKNTRRAYEADWADFEVYCAQHRFPTLPATDRVVQLYINFCGDIRGFKLSTIERRMAAIATKHHDEGHTSPTDSVVVKLAWKALKNAYKKRKKKPKRAIVVDEVAQLVKALVPLEIDADVDARTRKRLEVANLRILRDRALLLVGFAGAFRRSELVAITHENVYFDPQGFRIRLEFSKTNQDGDDPEYVAVVKGHGETCPVQALKSWLEAAAITAGPIFRNIDRHGNLGASLSDKAVALIVKQHALLAGLDPAAVAAHSLRSGFVTTAERKRIHRKLTMQQTRHETEKMITVYSQGIGLYDDNATADIGL